MNCSTTRSSKRNRMQMIALWIERNAPELEFLKTILCFAFI